MPVCPLTQCMINLESQNGVFHSRDSTVSVTHVLCALYNVELVAFSKIPMELKNKASDTWKLTIMFGRERLCHPSSVLASEPSAPAAAAEVPSRRFNSTGVCWRVIVPAGSFQRCSWITRIISSEACERGLEVWFRMRSSIGVLCLSDHTKFCGVCAVFFRAWAPLQSIAQSLLGACCFRYSVLPTMTWALTLA